MSLNKNTLDELKISRPATVEGSSTGRILVVVGIILACAAAWWVFSRKAAPAPEVKPIAAPESRVEQQKTVLNASGYVVARREATVSSKVTGKVIEVLIEEGMAVKERQVLARLDPANAEAGLRLAETQVSAAQAAWKETTVRINEARLNLDRVAALTKVGVASPADLDRAEAEVNSLGARLERQRAEALVAERQRTLAEQHLDDTIIRAPFDGVVVSKNAQPGEMISPMSAGGFTRTGICTIVDMESLEIEVDVNESFINRIVAGQAVTATLDAYAEWKIPAKVIAIVPTADRQKATVRVRVGFDKLDPRVLPQMGVKVAFQESNVSSQKGRAQMQEATP